MGKVKQLIDWENPDTWTPEYKEQFELAHMFEVGDFQPFNTATVMFWLKNWKQKVADSDYSVIDSGETPEKDY